MSEEIVAAPAWLSINSTAAYLETSTKSVRRLIATGKLPASNISTGALPIYRISREELEAWLKGRSTNAKPQSQKRRKEQKTYTSRYFPSRDS